MRSGRAEGCMAEDVFVSDGCGRGKRAVLGTRPASFAAVDSWQARRGWVRVRVRVRGRGRGGGRGGEREARGGYDVDVVCAVLGRAGTMETEAIARRRGLRGKTGPRGR